MRKLTPKLLCLLAFSCLLTAGPLAGQLTHRSPAVASTAKITDQLPCGGTVLFSEDFENGIPAGWVVIDGDGLTPQPAIGLNPGWQSRADYRDSLNNKVVCSPSWYSPAGKSNDWLISPAVVVGSNSCLSWKAYSQDQYFKEAYEVRIASQPDTAQFMANPALVTVGAETGTPIFNSASLAAYAGQTVYIAFRQVSDDKFVLCLDDVKVANVNAIDIGVFALTYGSPDLGDTVRIRFEVANYGSDTVRSFQALYTIDGGPAKYMVVSAVSLPPNSTVLFNHDSLYVADSLDAFHPLCAWTSLPNTVLDQDLANDTLCISLPIGHPVGVDVAHDQALGLQVYPNPFASEIHLRIDGLTRATRAVVSVTDLQGRVLDRRTMTFGAGAEPTLDLDALPVGMYLLQIEQPNGAPLQRRLIKR